jgi:ABC-type proline/glycine betaine transport system permease subunit
MGDPNSVGGIPHSGGVGGIPYSGNPDSAGSIPATVHFAPTAGLILDSTNAPIAGAPVLVLACDGTPIAATTTGVLGAFALTLPKVAGLTLVLPTFGIDDVPIVAGHPLLVIVP